MDTATALGKVFKDEENAKDTELISNVSGLLQLAAPILVHISTVNFYN